MKLNHVVSFYVNRAIAIVAYFVKFYLSSSKHHLVAVHRLFAVNHRLGVFVYTYDKDSCFEFGAFYHWKIL